MQNRGHKQGAYSHLYKQEAKLAARMARRARRADHAAQKLAKQRREGKPHNPIKAILLLLLFILVVATCVCMPAWYLTQLLLNATGWKPGVGPVLLVSCGWVFVFFLLAWIPAHLSRRFAPHKEPERPGVYQQAVEALERIASGDFDVLLDVDESYMFSEMAEKINHMARQLSSMETMRQDFVANVSHEIQSPLTSISGYTTLLQKPGITEAKRRHYLDVIQSETERLSRLSEDLLRMSTLDESENPLDATTFRLDKQLSEVLLLLEPQWAEKGQEVSLTADKLTITADRTLLEQVWVNIIYNAVKFTPEGGSISVEAFRDGDAIECSITDTGPGIKEEDRLHIFERFYKGDKSRTPGAGGSGLGLSLVRKIVLLHGGTVTLLSEEGSGSTFVVRLPV